MDHIQAGRFDLPKNYGLSVLSGCFFWSGVLDNPARAGLSFGVARNSRPQAALATRLLLCRIGEGGHEGNVRQSITDEAGGDQSTTVGPASIGFGIVPPLGQVRVIERDEGAVLAQDRRDLDPESAPVARVRGEITGDRTAAGDGDRPIGPAGDGKIGIRGGCDVRAQQETRAYRLDDRTLLDEGGTASCLADPLPVRCGGTEGGVQGDRRSAAILEAVAVAGFEVGFTRRPFGPEHGVFRQFDMVVGNRAMIDLTDR